MNTARALWIGAGAALATALALLVLLPAASATNDPPPGGGSVTGDWTVTDTREYGSVHITVVKGSVIIKSGAKLTLTGTELRLSSSDDGKYGIEVQSGGTLVLQSGANVSSDYSNVHYFFVVKGSMTMDDAEVSEVWGDTSSWKGGIQISSSNVSINNSRVTDGKTGGIYIKDCSPTITNSTIQYCGQDGASPHYAYGIYATNFRGTISRCNISYNQYLEITDYDGYSYQYPDMWYYDAEWNGNYYYWSWGWPTSYMYRYLEIYAQIRGNVWGKGIYIEGGSRATIEENEIVMNGWAKSTTAPDWSSYYEEIYEGSDYWYNYYYGYDEYVDFYLYYHEQVITAWRCRGIGLYIGNSTAEISGNVIDRNGYEVVDYYNWDDYINTFSGVEVRMLNSHGNITRNRITNGATLVHIVSSDPNVTHNYMETDFGQQTGNKYGFSATFVEGRVAYGIRCEESSPYIFNNTIKATTMEESLYIGGKEVFCIDAVLLLDCIKCTNVLIESNKITGESKQYGQISQVCANISYRSTGVQLLNSTLEYKFSGGGWWGGMGPNLPKLLNVALLSDVYIFNTTFRAPGAIVQWGSPPKVVGVQTGMGSYVSLERCRLEKADYGIIVRDFSRLMMNATNVTGCVDYSLSAQMESEVLICCSRVISQSRGMLVTSARVDIYDSNLSSALEFTLDRAASVNLYNTTHVRGGIISLDNASYLNASWPVKLHVLWQNGFPVDGARVDVYDMLRERVYSETTDESGAPPESFWLKEYMVHNRITMKMTPHRFEVSKSRASSMELYFIDRPVELELRLVDSIPPELVVLEPLDGERLSAGLVRFSGEASDPESGLKGSVVKINIDNKGWEAVMVVQGLWALTKPLSDGPHVVRLMAEDEVGNTVRTNLAFSIDTSAPVLYVVTPRDNSYINLRTVEVSGISEVGALVTVNGVAASMEGRWFHRTVSLEDGPSTIAVVAYDASGNSRRVEVRVVVDTEPPLIQVEQPRPGAFTNLDAVSVIGATEPFSSVNVNGVPAEVIGTEFEALVGLSEGVNTLMVRVVDRAGNTNSLSMSIYMDTTPPDLSLFTPRDELWTDLSRVLVSGATEEGVTVTVNGQPVNVVNTIFSTYVELVEGANRINVVARDAAGNSRAEARAVFLDTRPPDLVLTEPVGGLNLNTRVIPVKGSVDWGSEVFVNGEMVVVVDFVFSTTVMVPEDGRHMIEVLARDAAGNTVLEAREVNVDTSPPLVTISYPVEASRIKQRLVTVYGQTEPYATVVVNQESVIATGRDGLFTIPVVLQDGENRITVTAMDAAGNMATDSKTVVKPKPVPPPKADLTWALNLTGVLMGIGVAFPIAAHMLSNSWRRRRSRVLAELEAAEAERRRREAALAREYARPVVEKIGAKQRRPPEPAQPPQEHPEIKEAPGPEPSAEPQAAKVGLRDKSGAGEASPEEVDQATKMGPVSAPERVEKPASPSPPAEAGLKDKGTEAEGEAGETELPTK
ncbi:MAG: right-handed parallel beta-helix repeat-containing protein [Thermoplasmatota archaeon]